MSQRKSLRSVLLVTVPIVTGLVASFLWVRNAQRQYTFNRHLIEALAQDDSARAHWLVNAGADPNTTFDPPPKPTMADLWNYLFRHQRPSTKDSPTALQVASGAWYTDYHSIFMPDAPELVAAMLKHGGNIHSVGEYQYSLLHWAILANKWHTLETLIAHGADVNARSQDGETPLFLAWKEPMPSTVIRLLISHGADTNAADKFGDKIRVERVSSKSNTEELRLYLVPATIRSQVYRSQNHTLDATVVYLRQLHSYGRTPSRVEIRNTDGRLLASRDYSRDAGQGYTVVTAGWTADSQYFIYIVANSGGHSPWIHPIFFYSRKRQRFYSMDRVIDSTITGNLELRPPCTVLTKGRYDGKSRTGVRTSIQQGDRSGERLLAIDLRWLETHLPRSAEDSD